MKLTLSIFSAGLLIGAFAGALPNRKPPPSPAAQPTPPANTSSEKEQKKWSVADLHELDRTGTPIGEDGLINPLHHVLADWSADELKAALDEALKEPAAGAEFSATQNLMGFILAEWVQRDLDAALVWFESLKSQTIRGGLSSSIALWWPEDRAQEGLAYLVANRKYFSGNGATSSWPISKAALKKAAGQDAASFIGVLKLLRENQIYLPMAGLKFSDDFDFPTVMETAIDDRIWTESKADSFLSAWLQRDRDAAFDAIFAKNHELEVEPSRYLFSTDLPSNRDELADHVQWMADRIGTMPEQDRQQLLRKGSETWANHPDALKEFADSLEDPADRRIAHEEGARAILIAGVGNALHHLEALGDVEERIAFLESAQARKPLMPLPKGFPDTEEALLREKLTEWQVSPERADAIVQRIQKAAR